MELLEFKNKLFGILKITEVEQLENALLTAVLSHDVDIFKKYEKITDTSKDWLQALWQYYKADRVEKKQDYTPQSICNLVTALAGDCETVYDCCAGSGALCCQIAKHKSLEHINAVELDKRVIPILLFNLCLKNVNASVCNADVLTGEIYPPGYELKSTEDYSICQQVDYSIIKKADVAVCNPPYNLRWEPTMRIPWSEEFDIIPPRSSANWAFALDALSFANKAIMIMPQSIFSNNQEKEIRKYLIDHDLIETIITLPDKMFEATSITTCIVVLNKAKGQKGIIKFIDSRNNHVVEKRAQNGQYGGSSHTNRTYEKAYNVLSLENIDKIINAPENQAGFSSTQKNADIAENEYILTPSRYIEMNQVEEKPHRSFQDIADNINAIVAVKNSCKLVINETLARNLGLDVALFKEDIETSKNMVSQQKQIGVKLIEDDYISFSKAKNEIVFKCNDKDILPEVMKQFLPIWKNHVATLNALENVYLKELRDAVLPDLMSGKIEI